MKVSEFSKEQKKSLYKTMYRMRRFEEEVFEVYKRGLMPGLAHLYLGEEAIATGACATLKEDDYIASTHRGHGHLVAREADLSMMMAEILGKRDGYSKGKGGSMHIMAMDKGILGANGIVGAGIPIGTGAAYASRMRGTDQVTLAFFGDSASNQGTFHESLNMASAWKLPIVYIIENNLYGISVDVRDVTNVEDLSVRATGYGIEGVTIDGNDVFEVYAAVQKAVDKARAGEGPTLIECKTYRWQGHHVGDPATYRPSGELEEWKAREPLTVFKSKVGKGLKDADYKALEEEVEAEIQEAVTFAKDSPYADTAEAFTDIFAD